MIEKLLRPDEAAEILSIHRTTLWRHQQEGRIGYVRMGRNLRFRRADIEEFIERQRRAADGKTVRS